MRKFFTLALCLAAVCSVSAQKQNVDKAQKLVGKDSQTARTLIKQAMENPETQKDARTYFVAGKIEFADVDDAFKRTMINPNDPSVDPVATGKSLLDGYAYFLEALPLDSLPDAKGKIKPRFSKDILSEIAGHHNDFYSAGANFFNKKKFYPEAYQAFLIYADMPDMKLLGKMAPQSPDTIRATAYFNAGLAAYSGNSVEESAKAFHRASQLGYNAPEAYVYEIGCWQSIAQSDSTQTESAYQHIADIAKAGYEKFGLKNVFFINNLINTMVTKGDFAGALGLVENEIAKNPDTAMLYGLEGFIYDRKGDNDKSEAAYRKAISCSKPDAETLALASKKFYRAGNDKWNAIEGTGPEANAARQNIKTNYWEKALDLAKQAKSLNPKDHTLDRIIESLEYNLTTYF